MNILMVYPRHPDTFWSFRHVLAFLGKKAAFPPLGLLTVAAMLPTKWTIRLLDMNVRKLRDCDLAWADMVMVSAMLVQKESAQEVLARAQALGKKTVVGGPYYSSSDTDLIENVDHFILDEAEVTLPPFLADLESGNAKRVYRAEGKPKLAATPIPRWNLIRFKDYATMLIQFTRGCPVKCEFCDIWKLYGAVTRSKEALQFIREVQALYAMRYRGPVFIVDDNFIGNKKITKEMLPHLVEWGKEHDYPFTFFTEASVNMAQDNELMRLMRDASFTKVFLGIETPNVESLKECHKGTNTHVDLKQAVETIQAHGMEVLAGFIVGFDKDPPSIFRDQIAFIQETGIVKAMVGLLTALPKTELWERLKANGRLLRESTGDNLSTVVNFVPVMDRDILVGGYKRILSTIYCSEKNYYERVHRFLENLKPAIKPKLHWCDIRAFLMSTVRIGVCSRSRFLYWKLLLAHCRKKTFSVAVEAAIAGEHFKRVARTVIES